MHELRLLGGVKEAILDVLETESAGRPGHELPAAEEKRGSGSEVETSWGTSGCLSVLGWGQAGVLDGQGTRVRLTSLVHGPSFLQKVIETTKEPAL